MLIRRVSTSFLVLGIALVLLGLVLQQTTSKLLISDQLAHEVGAAEIAYHNASATPDSPPQLAAARNRLQEARDAVMRQRERGKGVCWWARTAGFALVILGGILRLATVSAEN